MGKLFDEGEKLMPFQSFFSELRCMKLAKKKKGKKRGK